MVPPALVVPAPLASRGTKLVNSTHGFLLSEVAGNAPPDVLTLGNEVALPQPAPPAETVVLAMVCRTAADNDAPVPAPATVSENELTLARGVPWLVHSAPVSAPEFVSVKLTDPADAV